MATKKIKPPPLQKSSPQREVDILPTVQDKDYEGAPNPNKTRPDFRPSEFDRAILQKGYYCVWRKAMLCTCKSQETDQANLACTRCDGSGYFYIDPIDLQVLITGMDKATDVYRRPGEWIQATCNMTVTPQYRLGYRDSITMKDSVMVYNEWLTKGNRRGQRSGLPDGTDSARYKIVNVNALFYADAYGNPKRLTEDIDFEITDNGLIKWLSGAASIPDKTIFTLHYEYHPIWIVITTPHMIRDTVVKFKKKDHTVMPMPIQCKGALDFIVSGAGSADEGT